MSQSAILKFSAIVAAFFGLALLLVPNALVAAYDGAELDATGLYNTMLYGGALCGLAVMNWYASDAPWPEARLVVIGNLVGDSLGLGAAVYRQLVDPALPDAAWINVLLFLVFIVLFARLLRLQGAP